MCRFCSIQPLFPPPVSRDLEYSVLPDATKSYACLDRSLGALGLLGLLGLGRLKPWEAIGPLSGRSLVASAGARPAEAPQAPLPQPGPPCQSLHHLGCAVWKAAKRSSPAKGAGSMLITCLEAQISRNNRRPCVSQVLQQAC